MRHVCMLAVCGVAAAANADFVQIDQFTINTSEGQAHGITWDGTNWYVAQIFSPSFDHFTADFDYVTTTAVGGGASAVRGITWDEDSGNFFVCDTDTDTVYEVMPGGAVASSFPVPTAFPNNIAINILDQTLWIASFDDGVFHYDRDGNLIDSFPTPGFQWTGLAIDEAADTLILLETGDTIYEYDFDGNQIDTLLPGDQLEANGQGLYYDAFTATLHATSQTDIVTIFQDPDRPVLGGECDADCNGDGNLDILDFVCFQALFQTMSPDADCNDDGNLDILDFVCFQALFSAGCD